MGLLKAGVGALSGVLADSWREYFYCEAIDKDILCVKGQKRNSKRSTNTKGEDNIISNGSIIAVADGQAMMIVEQGKIVEFCAEPGEFVFDSGTEPTIMYGGLNKENLLNTFKQIGKRFTFGGDTGKDQRVYYFNEKEILDNKYGTINPIPFRLVDNRIGLDLDSAIRCNGSYSYKIVNPMLFYKNVCGNVEADYSREEIDPQLHTEMLSALQPAFAKISALGIRYSELPGHTDDIVNALNEVLSPKWTDLRGIAIVSLGVNSLTASEEDEAMIKELQKSAVYTNVNMAAASRVSAQNDAMRAAAANEGAGPFMAFAGMNLAQNAGGDVSGLYAMGQQQPIPPVGQQAAPAAAGWTCPECGATGNTGKFCTNCGKPKPEEGWTCPGCGAGGNTGKFCTNCGKPKPDGKWHCPNCGSENTGKFCTNCGNPRP